MELNELAETLRELYNQIDFAHQAIEDGRIIKAFQQMQGAKRRTQILLSKVKDELAKSNTEDKRTEGSNS